MTDHLVDPRFWGIVMGLALCVFIGSLLLAAWLSRGRPEVVGAIRQRCEICEDAWAVPCTDDDLDLCHDCRRALDEASGRAT